jgi:hypothetical protein
MRHLVVFHLAAVVRYNYKALQHLAYQCLENLEDKTLPLSAENKEQNLQGLVLDIYQSLTIEPPSADKQKKIEKQFSKSLKKYFLEEEPFEERPGVQNIFNHIEKRKGWKYCILSPYWNKATHQILQSCGVFSKNKFTLTASHALTMQEQLEIAIARSRKKNKGLQIYLVDNQITLPVRKEYKIIEPKPGNGDNFFIYPKFTELFKPHL